jgi:hypothetical protein
LDLRIQTNPGQDKWRTVIEKCNNLYCLGCSFNSIGEEITSRQNLRYLLNSG